MQGKGSCMATAERAKSNLNVEDDDGCWKCGGMLKIAKRNGQEPMDAKWVSECVNPKCPQYRSKYAYIEGKAPRFALPDGQVNSL